VPNREKVSRWIKIIDVLLTSSNKTAAPSIMGDGLDFRPFRFIGLGAEVRDFLSCNPDLNVALNSSIQDNVVASGAVILHS